uniref:Peptidase M24 domain-containing protein n=1 Tax=Chromera velia CCMP2878 TaxID=1169474 RepID=A0A0G4H838_9ALVE|eukprot:Cvel_25052.t1-p1 / transcript=Cvel_25052.t1 / gene=Cvel_25052 / organism=Chromera_velia_CCMP2878 / gene_product=Xaa-Pro dipeptidase, putative / transcript_product=Xaa-Pro dipeptidase, putative / location=Cvel_scaffold2785:19713-23632(-) / protein_length=332 / sequence_SO=supercontig / SO=protein_coding / is_pseudo=false
MDVLLLFSSLLAGISKFELDDSALFPVLSESRVFKTPEEISFMRTANEVSSAGHRFVMELCKGGMWERQLEASFKGYCGMHGGARHEAYDCICASGPNAAVLHYGHAGAPNDRRMQDGDMVLLDMGCEYNGYATDITHTFPVSGKFTENQKVIYEGVLSASTTVKSQLRPGIQWLDMHRAAEREILKALKKAGVLNETAEMEEMIEADLGAVFMPHGLGHFLGLNVHDVGGYNQGAKRNPRPGLKYCRTSRALQEGMVLTVEPGCYFVDFLLDKALKDPKHSKFLNPEGVQKFRGFGGVRIEDNVLITADGHDCFTDVPRTVEDIERAMAAH